MSVQKAALTKSIEVRPGLYRRLIVTGDLMTVVLDFTDGPWAEAEPPHSHPHVQTCYLAEGEVVFYCEDEPDQRLKAGDVFAVPSGKKHTIKLLSKTARLVDNFNPVREDFL
ncbi:MAG: cupin domain-containing protein [Saprospiraceae bacterium]|nr:cupin domain-containing protein [Saprospiraceae bacterium]